MPLVSPSKQTEYVTCFTSRWIGGLWRWDRSPGCWRWPRTATDIAPLPTGPAPLSSVSCGASCDRTPPTAPWSWSKVHLIKVSFYCFQLCFVLPLEFYCFLLERLLPTLYHSLPFFLLETFKKTCFLVSIQLYSPQPFPDIFSCTKDFQKHFTKICFSNLKYSTLPKVTAWIYIHLLLPYLFKTFPACVVFLLLN